MTLEEFRPFAANDGPQPRAAASWRLDTRFRGYDKIRLFADNFLFLSSDSEAPQTKPEVETPSLGRFAEANAKHLPGLAMTESAVDNRTGGSASPAAGRIAYYWASPKMRKQPAGWSTDAIQGCFTKLPLVAGRAANISQTTMPGLLRSRSACLMACLSSRPRPARRPWRALLGSPDQW